MPHSLTRARHRTSSRLGPRASAAVSLVILLGPIVGVVRAQGGERSMYVSVLDSTEAPVQGLSPTDFVIEEDGAEREVLRVRPATTPMQVTVLVDTSGQTISAIGDVRTGLEQLVTALHENNEIALATFGGRPRILVESTGQLDRLRDGIGQIFGLSDTASYLLDALAETARGFERRESPRPVIIVITGEGIDYSSRSSDRVLDDLRSSQVAMHALVLTGARSGASLGSQLGQRDGSNSVFERDQILAMGPPATGGRRRDLLVSSAVGDALGELADVLSSQYEVVYSRPSSLIPPEVITVRMRRDELTAHGTPVQPTGL